MVAEQKRYVLGLETSSRSGGAALVELPAEWQSDAENLDISACDKATDNLPARAELHLAGSVCFSTRELYSQRLLPTVQWLLQRTQITMDQVAVVGVSVGPGSFTGLRIGLSVAKALAYASGARMVGVGTLEALAVRASGGRDARVCPMLDARHGQVYAALVDVQWAGGKPQIQHLREDWAGPIQEVSGWISDPTLFAGDCLDLARQFIGSAICTNYREPPATLRLPHPEEVALLSASRALAGQFDDPVTLEPKYVRQSYTSPGSKSTL